MTAALYSRVLQFCAGPQQERFYACAEHRDDLNMGWPRLANGVFFSRTVDPIEAVDPDDFHECDGCREP